MTTTIDINGTLILDQTSGPQDDDTAISNDLTGLSTTFKDFLNGLTGDLQLSAAQFSFADDVEAAVSGAGFVTVNPDSATISKLFFSDASGDPLDGDQVIYNGSPLKTADGDNIYLHSYANGTIVLATTSAIEGAGDVVAAFYLNVAGDNLSASIEMVTFEAIAHPVTTDSDDRIDWTDILNVSTTGSVSFNFNSLDSGANLFVAVGSADAGLMVSGLEPIIKANGTTNTSDSDTIKTSQGGIDATIGVNNQMFDPGETAVFSFIKGQATGNFDDVDNVSYSDFIDVSDASIFISQTEGTPSTDYTLKIGAFSAGGANTDPETGRSYIDNDLNSGTNLGTDNGESALADDTPVDIVRVVVKNASNQVVVDTTVDTSTVTFNGDGTVTVSGLDTGFTVQFFTDDSGTQAVETFNRFQLTGVEGKFDVGRVDLSQGLSVTESVGDKLHIDDDGPSISTTGTEPTLTVDESTLNINDTKSFAANFSSAFGTDGAGTLTYALSITGTASGLVDTATGQAVVLSVNGSGVVEGRTATSNDLVFTVSVSATGSVTLDQLRAVVHPDANNDDDSKSLSADDLIKLTATVTDKDGDHQSASLNIGTNLNFKDDGPSISTTGVEPTLTVDESTLNINDTKSFAANFSSAFGADGAGTLTYALSITGTASGLVDTATGQAVVLSVNGSGVVEGRTATSNDLVFTVSVSATGSVTLDQLRAVVHSDTNNDDDSKSLAADNLIKLTATVTDKDGDHHSATLDIGQNLNFKDDGPSISTTGTEPTLTVDESTLNINDTKSFVANFSSAFGADGAGTLTYALSITGTASGLVDTQTGQAVVLSVNGSGVVEGRTATSNDLVFTVSVSAAGIVTLDQSRAVVHPTSDPDESKTLTADDLIKLTATVTDKDGDHHSATLNIGQNLVFKDDGPTITVPFDGDASGGGSNGTHETLANTAGAQAIGAFGYNIGSDLFGAYDATHSDFVDQNGGLAKVQIGLTGTIIGGGGGTLLTSDVTLASEDATSATFNFTFTYDKDPADGTQTGTAGGTLIFNKDADTYTINLTDPLEGTSFDIIHTSEFVSKQPTSNSGHPPIVLETLVADDPNTQAHDGFFVQFTGNLVNKANPFSLTTNGEGKSNSVPPDTTFTGSDHDMVSNNNETWVSATQSTNGVAGDTIQKGELLTLRFFNQDVGIGSEALQDATNSTTTGAIAIKFDGIGSSEDLMLILDLTDGTNSITKAVYVSNDDIFRKGQVPAPYSSEFTLDNNDGLVIIEQNDYNTGSEHYVIQGVQIMQSGNGITGTAIELNGKTTADAGGGASTGTHAFDTVDNDVLKITDIGFSSTVTQTPDANLDFSFQVTDADGDVTPTSPDMVHILVDIA